MLKLDYKKTKGVLISSLLLSGAQLAFLPAASAQEDDLLGSFGNEKLQTVLEKPFYLYNEDKESAILFYLKDFIEWDDFLKKDFDYDSEIENPFYCSHNDSKESFCFITETFGQKTHYKKYTKIFLKESETKDYLNSISQEVNQNPSDGKFEFDDEKKELKILKKSRRGVSLQVNKSYEKIKNSIINESQASYLPLAVSYQEPEISTQDPNKYSIKTKIGTGESSFQGSTKTRVHNIKTAASKFHGLILSPGEEFSFVENLGEVDAGTGYKEELVIKKNQTVPEFGGGICQVSTTMFRAAYNTGLKITERQNHSYPVHYYDPPGTDATVYIPKPDFKFKNTTNDYLLIQTYMSEEKDDFYIYFYSKEDPYQVEIIGPKVTERTSEGKIRTELEQIVRNKDGEKIRNEVFKSFYDNPDNYPNPEDIHIEKPEDWPNKQWEEYYSKFGPIIEQKKRN